MLELFCSLIGVMLSFVAVKLAAELDKGCYVDTHTITFITHTERREE
jgi:hypothetical protein